MNEQRGQVRKLVGRSFLGLATAAMAAVLLAPIAPASPVADAEDAIMAAWQREGGDSSTLGARKGDVYPLGDGFALDFAGGKFFYTTATGAASIYGPILDRYEQLGGPVASDLGWPTISEVPGLAGPESRVGTFSASDHPVIFSTADHGAFVVRGPLNAAWDRLDSSGGVLGVPIEEETYEGDVVSQKFSGGELSWNRKTTEVAAAPPMLAEQLKGWRVSIDSAAAINMAWRAAGGRAGPLGAKKGGQYPIDGDGIAQDFVGGKVFFSPATGANALEGTVLAKYESLGGPVSSGLGFPTANESDGGAGPSSRMATFSAADKPVVFWRADSGAFVVRGAMKAAWEKLKGPTGTLGAPSADQTVDGDVISQKFSGGKISWNRAKNTFIAEPANLAPLLSGLQVVGQDKPSASMAPPHATKWFTWRWWYLAGIIPVLLIIVMFVPAAISRRRRHSHPAIRTSYELEHDLEAGDDGPWTLEDADVHTEHFALKEQPLPEYFGSEAAFPSRVSWPRGAGVMTDEAEEAQTGGASDKEAFTRFGKYSVGEQGVAIEKEDPDEVDTTPTLVVTNVDLRSTDLPGAVASEPYVGAGVTNPVVPEAVGSHDFAAEGRVPDATVPPVPVSETPISVTPIVRPKVRIGRHAAADSADDGMGADSAAAVRVAAGLESIPPGRPTIHLPLADPYRVPPGYPIKASVRFGLYYTSCSALYNDTLAEIWFVSEEVAQANGFVKAD